MDVIELKKIRAIREASLADRGEDCTLSEQGLARRLAAIEGGELLVCFCDPETGFQELVAGWSAIRKTIVRRMHFEGLDASPLHGYKNRM